MGYVYGILCDVEAGDGFHIGDVGKSESRPVGVKHLEERSLDQRRVACREGGRVGVWEE